MTVFTCICIAALVIAAPAKTADDPQDRIATAVEARGWWNHSGLGPYPGDWNRSAKELSEAGFTMIFPNMAWASQAHYPSDVLPRSNTYKKYGDQIAQCLKAAKKYGIEVHVWKINYNLGNAPEKQVEKLRREGRLQVDINGKSKDWLCPSHPKNFQLELDSMLEIVRKYDVDGIQLDYIRWPDGQHCFCKGCRKQFEKDSGKKVDAWPKDCHAGKRREEFYRWRASQISKLVAATHDQAKQIRADIKISAAVFGYYPSCRDSVGQDWVGWAKAGHVDFLCPMNYTEDDEQFESMLKKQIKLLGGSVPIYPGIGVISSRSRLSPDQIKDQINLARRLGARGFMLFNLTPTAAETILPKLDLDKDSKGPKNRNRRGKPGR